MIVFVGCDSGSGNLNESPGNIDPKTLVMQMPVDIYALLDEFGFRVGVFPLGTADAQAFNNIGIVAGGDKASPGVLLAGTDLVSITVHLYNITDGSRWTGSGTYDIFVFLNNIITRWFEIYSVNISSGITNIPSNSIFDVSLN